MDSLRIMTSGSTLSAGVSPGIGSGDESAGGWGGALIIFSPSNPSNPSNPSVRPPARQMEAVLAKMSFGKDGAASSVVNRNQRVSPGKFLQQRLGIQATDTRSVSNEEDMYQFSYKASSTLERQVMNPWTTIFRSQVTETRYREYTKGRRYRWVKWKMILGTSMWVLFAIIRISLDFSESDQELSRTWPWLVVASLIVLLVCSLFFIRLDRPYTDIGWLQDIQTFWLKWWRLVYAIQAVAFFNIALWAIFT